MNKKRIISFILALVMVLSMVPGQTFAFAAGEDGQVLTLRYDDRYDVSGKTVEILDAGTPTSYQVGYGVEEKAVRDTAVVTLEGDKLIATGIGTARVSIDGVVHEVTVTSAPISLLLLIGQSNMEGNEGDLNQSISCPDGMVYATYGDRYDMTLANATHYAPSALTGAYRTVNAVGGADGLSDYPVYMLTEEGSGRKGPDSGFAYEWVQQTGEKVWIVNASHGGTSINVWQPGTTQYEECQAMFGACAETLRKEIAAGHFTLSHMAYFWCQGCNDYNMGAREYREKYLIMHESLKTELAFDHDSDTATEAVTFEFGGIIPVRRGHSWSNGYRGGIYTDTTTRSHYESFMDLQMTGPRVAQYMMCSDPELEDIWLVCTIGEDWVWMPDGTNGVSEYFNKHYENGRVDYEPQVAQPDSWYTPTTPKAVHDSIHYNQIGYNEVGRESVRNALILMGINPDYEEETTVKFVDWTGYREVTEIPAITAGQSSTLVVPMVSPITRSKDVTYSLSAGLSWDHCDLLAQSAQTTSTLTAVGAAGAVSVVEQEPGAYFADHLSQLPEELCGGTDLWDVLEHDEQYYTVSGWGIHSSGEVYSVTIPVEPGDRIYSTSFGKAGENGHINTNGIRTTFLGAYSVVRTMDPTAVYTEFAANGYLTVPEGAMTINVPMWTNGDENELYILNLPHDSADCLCTLCGKADHRWSDWQTVTESGPAGPGTEQRVCADCGEAEERTVDGVWQDPVLAAHLTELPEVYCSGTDLWAVLPHDGEYFHSGTHWGVNTATPVYSVTIPIAPGERISATSFRAAGANNYTSAGIRVTFFDANGDVVKTMSPAETHAEFKASGGYITAPAGAAAVNVPMYGESGNELYLLNGAHTYENGICTGCGEDVYPDILDGHLQMLPEEAYAHTNLWPLLVPENVYFYAGTHWGSLDDVVSVTIPVAPGDQIYAGSFKRGIRVAFFDTDGLLVSMSSLDVKEEFEEKGYITVPEGAIAANIPMWDSSADNVLRILTLERVTCEEHAFSVAEIITEPGLVSKGSAIRVCENCGYTETAEIPELMQAGVFAYQKGDESVSMPYRIYYPSSYGQDDQEPWPIVVFYHGAGSRGSDNQAQVLGKTILDRLVELDQCIIIAPQCDTGCQWVNTPWGGGSYDSASVQRSVYLDASVALLDETILAGNADEDRVYAIGLSMGGYAAWNVMMEYPEKFAAVVPVCGAADPGRAGDVLGVAVWAFHGDEDPTVPVSGSREMVEAIRALGGAHVRYTEYEGVGHASWVNAFAEPELTNWLFAQKRHAYTPAVTAPTCTEKGYTTYTCSCGDSYVADYVEATGIHTYEDAACTQCGAILYGDVNGDGSITVRDLALLRKYLANKDPATGESTVAVAAGADANGADGITVRDLAMLRKYLANKDPETGESSVVLGPQN